MAPSFRYADIVRIHGPMHGFVTGGKGTLCAPAPASAPARASASSQSNSVSINKTLDLVVVISVDLTVVIFLSQLYYYNNQQLTLQLI